MSLADDEAEIEGGCAPWPWDEDARLEALDAYGILDTDREPAFDEIAALAADLFDAPIAVVNFIADGRQWFKAEVGIGQRELPLDVSICRHAILQPGIFVVPDLTADPRFATNPLVTVAGGLRFYAGALLTTPEGLPLGTVCVLDREPRPQGLSERKARLLQSLAAQVMAQMELRRSETQARRERKRFETAFAGAGVGMVLFDGDLRIEQVNPRFCSISGVGETDALGASCSAFTHPGDVAENERMLARVLEGRADRIAYGKRYLRADGEVVWVDVTVTTMQRDHAGRATSMLAIVEDVTERKRAEVEAAEYGRLLEMIASGQPLDTCLTAATAAVARLEPRLRACILVPDPGGRTFERGYSAQLSPGFCHAIRGARIEDIATGTCGSALHTGEPVVRADIVNDERWPKAWQDLCTANGIRACHSEPVIGVDGRTLAAVLLCLDEARETTERERQTATFIARVAAVALERDRSSQALRESEAHLSAIFGQASAGLSEISLDGRFRRVNDALCTLLGRSREELLTLSVADVTHPDDLAMNARLLSEATDGGVPFSLEKRYLRPDGATVWAASNVSRILDEAGRPACLLAVTVDLTGQRAAQAAVRESEERLRLIVEGAKDYAIITLDAAGAITGWNAGAERLLGYTASEALGQPAHIFFTPEDIDVRRPETEMALARDERRATNERWHIRKDGSRFWGSGVLLPLTDSNDGFVAIFRDRTEEHDFEARLRRRSDQLQALAEAALAVGQAPTVEATLDEVTKAARRIIGAHQGVVSLTRGSDWRQAINAVALTDKYAAWRDYDGATDGSGIYAWVCEENRPLRLTQAELEAHPRWRGFGRHVTEHPPMRGWLAAPLIGRDGRNLGLIQLSDKEDGSDFDEGDEAMLVQLAQLASGAVEQSLGEAALRESEERFRAAVDAVQGILWTNTPEGRMEGEQPGWSALTGQTPEEYQGYGWAQAVHPDDASGTVEAWEAAVRERRMFVFEHRVRRHDGVWRAFSIRAIPVLDERGEVRQWVGVHSDVTEQRAAEAALRDSEARYREELQAEVAERTRERDRIWQVSQDAFVVANTAGIYLSISPGFERILGWGEADVVGKPFFDLVHPDDIAPTQAEMGKLADGARTFYFENRFRDRDGRWRWLAWTAVPEGELIYAVARDVTAEKATRAELEAAQAQVVEMQKLETIGQLTGGIAHDFNNLLMPIVGGLDMLRRRLDSDDRSRRTIENALQSAERARVLVNRLLAFARRQHLEARSVALPELVRGMGDLIDRSLGPQIDVRLDLPEDLPSVTVDPGQLELAVLNLAVNARDAMPAGGVLTISAQDAKLGSLPQRLSTGQYVRLSVSDTGTGMDPGTLKRAVEPFYTTKGVGRGTGLGLSMVHGLAAQSGGALILESAPGQGTTASIYLPVSTGQADAHAWAVETGEPVATMPLNVLLVDDEELVRVGTADILESLGHTVLQAASGAAALNLLRGGAEVDIMLTDYMMPGMTGVALTREARAMRPRLPVLLMTGYANLDPATGGDLPRLGKPFRTTDLAAAIKEALDVGRVVRLASRRPPQVGE